MWRVHRDDWMKFITGLIRQWLKSWQEFFCPADNHSLKRHKNSRAQGGSPAGGAFLTHLQQCFLLSSHVAVIQFTVITWEDTCITQLLSNFSNQNGFLKSGSATLPGTATTIPENQRHQGKSNSAPILASLYSLPFLIDFLNLYFDKAILSTKVNCEIFQ